MVYSINKEDSLKGINLANKSHWFCQDVKVLAPIKMVQL
jgi:hypothetical protein